MNPFAKSLAISVSVGAVLTALVWRAQTAPTYRPAPAPVAEPSAGLPTETVPPVSTADAPLSGNLVTHAIDIARLDGFPPDAAPGDVFDIWVAWNPPVVKGPNIQLLLKDVGLEKIAPAVTRGGPNVAFLLLPRADARELLYASRYGVLSVTQPTEESAGF